MSMAAAPTIANAASPAPAIATLTMFSCEYACTTTPRIVCVGHGSSAGTSPSKAAKPAPPSALPSTLEPPSMKARVSFVIIAMPSEAPTPTALVTWRAPATSVRSVASEATHGDGAVRR